MISVQALEKKAYQWQNLRPQLQEIAQPVVNTTAAQKLIHIDLSAANTELAALDVVDTAAIDRYIQEEVKRKQAAGAVGGYLENRFLYLRSTVFAGEEHRTLHLGVDVWLPAQTPVYAILPGVVHSFADNANFGDYGPTLILEHEFNGLTFYSLYGHLSRHSLKDKAEGMAVEAGFEIGSLGEEAENGNWPPHLHFQLMLDMEGRKGDFPGVGAPSKINYYQLLCPDPNPLLKFI